MEARGAPNALSVFFLRFFYYTEKAKNVSRKSSACIRLKETICKMAQTSSVPVATLDENISEIDKINSADKITRIFVYDVLPAIQQAGPTLPRACILIWPTTAAFLRRLQGDVQERPVFKEISLAVMRGMYPTSKSLAQAEQTPKAVAISCAVHIQASIVPGQEDKLMNMNLTILQPPV